MMVVRNSYSSCDHGGDNGGAYSRGSEEGTQASGEERFQGQEEEEVGQTHKHLNLFTFNIYI